MGRDNVGNSGSFLIKCIENTKHLPSGVAEYRVAALCDQEVDDDLCAVSFHKNLRVCKIKAPAVVLPGLRFALYRQSGLSVIHKRRKGRTTKHTVNNNDRVDNNADNNNGGCQIIHQAVSLRFVG
jgi:hypothetical protein